MKPERIVLDNGLTVLYENRSYPSTTMVLASKYGAAYETEENKGIAHVLEHMCFKGTKKRNTKEIAYGIEKVGGLLNAFTDEEETAYYATIPSEELRLAMDTIFDLYFNPTFPAEELKKETNVICEEIKMGKDNPMNYTARKLGSCLYKKPFGMPIIGTKKNVKSVTRKQLLKVHKDFYAPGNSILVVVGNNNLEEILELAETFSSPRTGKKPKPPKKNLQHLRKKERRDGIQQATLALGFHFPTAVSDERYAAKVFSSILGKGMSSKLFTEVREKRGLAYTVGSSLGRGRDYGCLMIYAGTSKDKVDEVIEICVKEFEKMGTLPEKELEDGKKQLIGNYKVGCESSSAVANSLIYIEVAGKTEDAQKYEERIQQVSLDDIVKLAKIKDYAYFALTP